MSRPFFLQENVQRATTIALLIAVLIVATARSILVHHSTFKRYNHFGHIASDTTFFISGSLRPHLPPLTATSSFYDFETFVKPQNDTNTPDLTEDLSMTQQQRSRHIMLRLSHFSGSGKGFARIAHVVVSLVGIIGMFSAIVGALIGPWLADTGEDGMDEDRFAYWVRPDDDDERDDRTCGLAREDKYGLQRLLDTP